MNDPKFEPAPIATDLRQELGRRRTDLTSDATFLTFDPGLYSIDFRATSGSMSDVGLPLPCARLEPVVNPGSAGRAFVSLTPDSGWLSRATATAHVLVVGGRAGAVLTIYRPADGTPMPEVQFRSVVSTPATKTGQPPDQAAAPLQPDGEPANAELGTTEPGTTAILTIHLETVGDVSRPSGDWVGDTTGQRSIEGFALSLPAGMAASDVEYQGIMGEDWRTPWFESGAFCGSRGLQLPLLGFCLRLVGAAADKFECRVYGQFVRAGSVGPVGSGADCNADNMPLTAMKVEIVATAAAPPADAAPAAEPVADIAKKPRWRRPKPDAL
jgi:hypothetical protein